MNRMERIIAFLQILSNYPACQKAAIKENKSKETVTL
jgi:hypothetical protein